MLPTFNRKFSSRSPSPHPAGIRFADYFFSEPVHLVSPTVVYTAGVYVILTPDTTWGPKQFQPVFFGECKDSRGSIDVRPDQYLLWLRAAAGRPLYIAILPTPFLHPSDLSRITRELVNRYEPICNRDRTDSALIGPLAHRLDALEKKYVEQEALLRLALAAIGHLVVLPTPEPKKKVGFRR